MCIRIESNVKNVNIYFISLKSLFFPFKNGDFSKSSHCQENFLFFEKKHENFITFEIYFI